MSTSRTPADRSRDEAMHTQHEKRFATLDREISQVKTDVGVLQSDVKNLAAGQLHMQASQDRGFTELKDALQAKSQEPPRVGVGLLLSGIGVLLSIMVAGLGAVWASVMLVAQPMQLELREQQVMLHETAKSATQTRADLSVLATREEHTRPLSLDRAADLKERNDTLHAAQAEMFRRMDDRWADSLKSDAEFAAWIKAREAARKPD